MILGFDELCESINKDLDVSDKDDEDYEMESTD